jgi:uncharacterized SAM-binding protein YcdF (DUF218 family)
MIEIIIVLGNSTDGVYQKRVDRAIEHFTQNSSESYIMFSGLKANVENMYNYALSKLGSKYEKFLLKENKSTTTVENILLSMKIIKNLFPKVINLTICTSTYHIKRSIIITNLLCKHFNTKFIHTSEPITPEQKINEERNTANFLNDYTSYYV